VAVAASTEGIHVDIARPSFLSQQFQVITPMSLSGQSPMSLHAEQELIRGDRRFLFCREGGVRKF
jgi:hypothetical protein